MKEKHTALVTGATNGIGFELTRKLLADGWQVAALVRSEFRKDDRLIADSLDRGRLRTYQADLADYGQLRTALARIQSEERPIDVLFNNAGGSFPELLYSKQGRELHYELQTVVPYVILMELKELLLRGTLRTVVNTSSNAFKFLKRFDPDSLDRPKSFKKLIGPYAASKLALSLWTREIAPRLAADGILIRSADPGGNNTLRSGKNSGLPFYVKPLMKLIFPPPTHGASLLYEAAVGANKHLTGAFLSKNRPVELPFAEHGSRVLEKVSEVYGREYAAAT